MVVYCFAHLSLYEFLASLLSAFCRKFALYDFPYMVVFLAGVSIAVSTGSVWDWLTNQEYAVLRFDMQNRARLQHWDTKILKYLRTRPRVKYILDILALYCCFIGCGFFLHQLLLPALCDVRDVVLKELPSLSVEDLEEKTSVHLYMRQEYSPAGDSEEEQYMYDATLKDETYVYNVLSTDSYNALMGNPAAVLVTQAGTLLFYGTCAFLSLGYLYMKRVAFWGS